MTIANMAAGQIAIRTGFKGMCTCPVTACAGGTNAVGDAFHHIRDGYADVMLCGGAEAAITPLAIGGFTSMKALSHEPTTPTGPPSPLTPSAAALSWARAPASWCWRSWSTPKARGAKIYAEVVGYGATCDAYHMTAPGPDGSGRRARPWPMALAGRAASPRSRWTISTPTAPPPP